MPRRALVRVWTPLLTLALAGCVTTSPSAPNAAAPSSASAASPAPLRTEPSGPATATPAVAGEASPPAGMPATPDAALRETDAGARAFAAHYFTVETTAYSTMNGALLDPLSAAECSACYRTFALIEDEREQHHTFDGYTRAFSATSVQHYPAEPHTVSVVGSLSGTRTRRLDDAGKLLSTFDPPSGRAAVSMMWHRDRWLVTNLQLLE